LLLFFVVVVVVVLAFLQGIFVFVAAIPTGSFRTD